MRNKAELRCIVQGGDGSMEEKLPEPLVTPKEAAEYLRVKPQALLDWRRAWSQQGPPYIRLGPKRIRYDAKDLKAFIQQRRVIPRPKNTDSNSAEGTDKA
jgi:hypothetical protein